MGHHFEIFKKIVYVFFAIGVLSALLIFLVTLDAKHRQDYKMEHKQGEISIKKRNSNMSENNFLSHLTDKLYSLWKLNNSNPINVGIEKRVRKKRHSQELDPGSFSKLSMVQLTIQQEPKKDNNQVIGDWNENSVDGNIPVLLQANDISQFGIENYQNPADIPRDQFPMHNIDHEQRHFAEIFPNAEFENFNINNEIPELQTRKTSKSKHRAHRKREKQTTNEESVAENSGNSLTYIFSNNSVYVIEKGKHRRHRRRDFYIYSWVELAIAAAGAVALTVTFVVSVGLVAYFCCPTKKKRRQQSHNTLLLNMDDLTTDVVPANCTKNAAVLFTKSYIQLERNPAGFYLTPQSTKLSMESNSEKDFISNNSERRSSSQPLLNNDNDQT